VVKIREPRPDRPRPRPGLVGYRLGDQEFDGFPDQPRLPARERARIARWALQADAELSEVQRELLERHPPEGPSAAQQQGAEDRRWMEVSGRHGLLRFLSPEQARLVRQPSLHPELASAGYPLTVGELARLAGATERQVRHWANLGLLRVDRQGEDRRFWPAAAATAAVLAAVPQHVKATTATIARGEGAPALALMAEALVRWGESLPSDQRPRVEAAAAAIAELAEPAAAVRPEEGPAEAAEEAAPVPDLMAALRASLDATSRAPEADRLAPAEQRILRALGEGATPAEIAAELVLTEKTVGHHLATIAAKLGVTPEALAGARQRV
jgi:DNA-binding CsgD family transcriptional regulator